MDVSVFILERVYDVLPFPCHRKWCNIDLRRLQILSVKFRIDHNLVCLTKMIPVLVTFKISFALFSSTVGPASLIYKMGSILHLHSIHVLCLPRKDNTF
ncbi:hypothetical protein HanRHA438_Chr05g0213361 [Helianthus annuus]|nr:hypothetical protein HanRHA438_Chr05g0213361 [Helianthus annuus]